MGCWLRRTAGPGRSVHLSAGKSCVSALVSADGQRLAHFGWAGAVHRDTRDGSRGEATPAGRGGWSSTYGTRGLWWRPGPGGSAEQLTARGASDVAVSPDGVLLAKAKADAVVLADFAS